VTGSNGSQASCWERPLLSPAERQAWAALEEILAHSGSLILPGFKLSQVIRHRPPGISASQWDYATRAHFDFVVCDAASCVPEFAVELDDRTHLRPDAQRRDRDKDALCQAAGFGLLRVESSAFDRGPRGRRLVEYLIDARSYTHAFYEAQARGHVPDDWFCDYRAIIGPLPGGGFGFVNDLAEPARARAQRAFAAGRIEGHGIQDMSFSWKNGWSEAWAWLQVRGDLYLFEKTRLRSFRFDCIPGPMSLSGDLAAVAVGRRLGRLGDSDPVLVRRDQMARQLQRVRERRDELECAFSLSTEWF
jgi:uncharacterized protein DUF2726